MLKASHTSSLRPHTLIALVAGGSYGGGRVRVVDIASGFEASQLTIDGVHPNAEGALHVANR